MRLFLLTPSRSYRASPAQGGFVGPRFQDCLASAPASRSGNFQGISRIKDSLFLANIRGHRVVRSVNNAGSVAFFVTVRAVNVEVGTGCISSRGNRGQLFLFQPSKDFENVGLIGRKVGSRNVRINIKLPREEAYHAVDALIVTLPPLTVIGILRAR